MDPNKLYALVSLILALSVASERLVEIVKGLWPWLNKAKEDNREEGRRRTLLHVFAVVAGMLTALLAQPIMPEGTLPKGPVTIIGLGFLVSGGSGFWNGILSYIGKVKDLKAAEISSLRKE